MSKPRFLVVIAQALHGFAYVWFIIAGQMLADTLAPEEIRGSMQALMFTATIGIGLFVGTQAAGLVMDKNNKDGKFVWRRIFLVPCITAAIFILVFAVFFKL